MRTKIDLQNCQKCGEPDVYCSCKPQQHTPTPWNLEDKMGGQSTKLEAPSENREFIDPMTGASGVDHSPKLIARISTFHDEGKANAAFIVRCCSNYEGMIELLRETYSENGGANGKLKGKIEEAFKRAGEVL